MINATDAIANAAVRGEQVPMAPGVAADQLLAVLLTGGRHVNWGRISPWVDDAIANKSFPTSPREPVGYTAAACTSGLLPPEEAASDKAQRD
jgi:hypothetical protein